MNPITQKINEIRKETNVEGNRLLDELIDLLVNEIDSIQIKMLKARDTIEKGVE